MSRERNPQSRRMRGSAGWSNVLITVAGTFAITEPGANGEENKNSTWMKEEEGSRRTPPDVDGAAATTASTTGAARRLQASQ